MCVVYTRILVGTLRSSGIRKVDRSAITRAFPLVTKILNVRSKLECSRLCLQKHTCLAFATRPDDSTGVKCGLTDIQAMDSSGRDLNSVPWDGYSTDWYIIED